MSINIQETISQFENLLGDRVVERLIELSSFEDGWDNDGAKKMSLDSLTSFLTFAKNYPLDASDLGIFLGFEGEILINWHIKDGSLIDLDFDKDEITVYTDNYEGSFPYGNDDIYKKIHDISLKTQKSI